MVAPQENGRVKVHPTRMNRGDSEDILDLLNGAQRTAETRRWTRRYGPRGHSLRCTSVFIGVSTSRSVISLSELIEATLQ